MLRKQGEHELQIHATGHILSHEVFGHRRNSDFRLEAVIRQGCLDGVGVNNVKF